MFTRWVVESCMRVETLSLFLTVSLAPRPRKTCTDTVEWLSWHSCCKMRSSSYFGVCVVLWALLGFSKKRKMSRISAIWQTASWLLTSPLWWLLVSCWYWSSAYPHSWNLLEGKTAHFTILPWDFALLECFLPIYLWPEQIDLSTLFTVWQIFCSQSCSPLLSSVNNWIIASLSL